MNLDPDAFFITWTILKFYLFSPFNLIEGEILKIKKEWNLG